MFYNAPKFKGFMVLKYPVYVISLQKDEWRRDRLRENFKSYDEFEMIDAFDAKNLSATKYYEILLDSLLKSINMPAVETILLSPTEMACAISHTCAYERFLDSGAKFGLIFEDDIVGNDDDIKRAFELCEKISEDSIFVCGAQDGLSSRFRAFGKRLNNDLFLISPYSYASIYRGAAYIVTRQSAKALLDFHKSGLYVVDRWATLLNNVNLKMYFSNIFTHPVDIQNSNLQAQRDRKNLVDTLFIRKKSSLKDKISRFYNKHLSGNQMIFK